MSRGPHPDAATSLALALAGPLLLLELLADLLDRLPYARADARGRPARREYRGVADRRRRPRLAALPVRVQRRAELPQRDVIALQQAPAPQSGPVAEIDQPEPDGDHNRPAFISPEPSGVISPVQTSRRSSSSAHCISARARVMRTSSAG